MNPIDYNDLVKGDPFGRLIKEGEDLIKVYEKLGESLRNAMAQQKLPSTSPSTLKEAEDTQKLIDKITALEENIKKSAEAKKVLTVETAKLKIQQQEEDKITKELAKDQLGLISAYQKESKTLNDLRKEYKDLALAEKESTAEGKQLLANITELDAKLKKVDATVGQHQRSVGNYSDALKNAKAGLMQFGGALGLAFGVTEMVNFGKESVQLASKLEGIEKAFKKLNNPALLDELRVATKGTVSDMALMQSAVKANNFKLPLDQLAGLFKFATQRAQETGESVDYLTESIVLGISRKSIPILDNLGLSSVQIQNEFKKTGDFAKAVGNIVSDSLKQQGDMAETSADKMARLGATWENFKVSVGQFLIGAGEGIVDFMDQFGEGVDKAEKVMAQVNSNTKDFYSKQFEDIAKQSKKSESERLKAVKDNEFQMAYAKEQGLKTQNVNLKRSFLTEFQMREKFAIRLANLDKEIEAEKNKGKETKEKEGEDFDKKLRDLRTANIQISYQRRRKEVQDTYDDETKQYKGQTAILEELAIKRKLALELIYRDEQREYDKIRKDAMKVEKLDLMKADDPVFSPKVKANREAIIKKEKDNKEAMKREREYALQHADDLYNVWKEAQEKKSAEQMAYIDHELQRNQSALDIQLELASRGMDNTLDYEMKKRDELEKSRVQELERQKKVAKQQEALELSLAFLKAYETYISQDMKSGEALLRASGDIFTAKMLSKAISGSALDGVEDTGTGGNLDADGGMLWKLHPHERVLTKEQNARLNGVSNDDLVNKALMFDNIMNPNFKSSLSLDDVSKSTQVANTLNIQLLREVRELKEVMKNKPTNETNIDNLGNVVKRTVENGLVKVTTKKTYLS